MLTREQTILLVSDDAALCTAARLRLECLEERIRVSSVTNIDAAHLILEDATPAVILFEQASSQFNGAFVLRNGTLGIFLISRVRHGDCNAGARLRGHQLTLSIAARARACR